MKHISTTALSKSLNISSKELFTRLSELGFIVRENESWVLTDQGKAKGGSYKKSERFGEYIVWPEDLSIETPQATSDKDSTRLVTSTVIANQLALSASTINAIFLKLDWIAKNPKGWILTKSGKKQGGVQAENKKSDTLYILWPESIVESSSFSDIVNRLKKSKASKTKAQEQEQKEEVGFRGKFEAKHRSADGHFVRSKAEMIIDNWLYMAEIVHAYERKLPIEEDVYSDFYIPTGKVYVDGAMKMTPNILHESGRKSNFIKNITLISSSYRIKTFKILMMFFQSYCSNMVCNHIKIY